MSRDLPQNLRLLCSYHKSVAEVCRRLGVNRSQFNRYLNGTSFPSLRLMRRLCDFFGVEESELLLPHGQFAEVVRLKPSESGVRAETDLVAAIAGDLRQGSRAPLDHYTGYYFTYYNSMSHPGLILRSLTRLYRTPHGINVKSVESVGFPGARKFTCKYEGACFMLGDRIFMTVMEMLTRNEVMQIILYPSYNNRIRFLTGVVSGVAARAPRPPAATQIVFQYLGKTADLRKSMRMCALLRPEDPQIPEEIRSTLAAGLRDRSSLIEAPLS
ncbi:helix-turn-helix transcriptional regulator [Cribrihabitans neustonicus]|uniref:helix-turn-helix transcriptional regulator n=1 Tax=Cribrihabitans neustonicus TaxID=1429085 RepID=UPI003B5C70B3